MDQQPPDQPPTKSKRTRRPYQRQTAGVCGAKRNKRPGKTCSRPPMVGATRCYHHGGTRQAMEPGDPRRMGRPSVTRLHIGETGLTTTKPSIYLDGMPDTVQRAFKEADLDSLDDEVRVACANLRWAIEQFKEDPNGGLVISTGQAGSRIMPYSVLVMEHVDRVRRLKTVRWARLEEDANFKEMQELLAWAEQWTPRDAVQAGGPHNGRS